MLKCHTDLKMSNETKFPYKCQFTTKIIVSYLII